MANRFQKNQHHLAYGFIVERDGEYCLICRKTPRQVKLQIDHANNNPDDWTPANLHLLCYKHNLEYRKLTVKEKISLISKHSAINERERARARGNYSTAYVRSKVDYTQGSPEMQVNAQAELQWREWIIEEIRTHGFIIKEIAVYTGAELFGISASTTERYLRKLCNPRAEFTVTRDGTGAKIIKYKGDK